MTIKINNLLIRLFFAGVFALLLLPFDTAFAASPISWQPKAVTRALGNGQAVTYEEVITFTSTAKLNDLEMWITPSLRPFVTIEPTAFREVQPGIPYTVRARFSIPTRATEGVYGGTIHARVGSRTVSEVLKMTVNIDYGDVAIPHTTYVLTEASTSLLTEITLERLVFAARNQELNALSPGDVIVIGVTAATPNGLLRKVSSITFSATGIVINTEPATLADAITYGSIYFTERLTPSGAAATISTRRGSVLSAQTQEGFYLELNDIVVYDNDGSEQTTDDQIKVNGSVSLDPLLTVDVDQNLNGSVFVSIEAMGEIEAKAEVSVSAQRKLEVARYPLAPMTVFVGFVPVVIQPIVSINIGVNGEVSAGVSAGIVGSTALEYGLAFESDVNGCGGGTVLDMCFTRLGQDPDPSLQFDPPTVSAGFNAQVYAGPQISVLFYGFAGPYLDAKFFFELETDVSSMPWWELFGGVEGGAGVRAELFGQGIEYYDPNVIGYRRLLAQATTPPPFSRGTIVGSVRDAVTGVPLPGVTVTARAALPAPVSALTDGGGLFRLDILSTVPWVVTFSKAGYLPAQYHNASVNSGETTYLEAVLQIDESHAGLGDIGGRILNALTGTGLSGLQLALRAGINVTSGDVVASTVSGVGGGYSFAEIPAGQYTVEIGGQGYLETFFTVVSIGGVLTGNQDAAVAPMLTSGATRIVLTWGEVPRDLDSHLTGPLLDGSRFHMSYSYAGGSSPWPDYVVLDLDDVTSYGPETTTIVQQIPGAYRFSVHDYTNRSSTTSTALSGSGAQVRVYRGSDLVATFNAPVGQSGTLWTVFELNGDAITPINVMSFVSSPSMVQMLRSDILSAPMTDEWLLGDLPLKTSE